MSYQVIIHTLAGEKKITGFKTIAEAAAVAAEQPACFAAQIVHVEKPRKNNQVK